MSSDVLLILRGIAAGAAVVLDAPVLARSWPARRKQEAEAEALESAASLPGLANGTHETLRNLWKGTDDLAYADASDCCPEGHSSAVCALSFRGARRIS